MDTTAQKSCCYWLTGLSGAGKSTIANLIDETLRAQGYRSFVLDGDRLRLGLNNNLSFTKADRSENVRRISEVAKLMVEAGLVVVVSAISPYEDDRQAARRRFRNDEFFEVFIDTDIEVCMERDPKGLYRRAKAKEITHFTGVDDPYERPTHPEFLIDTDLLSARAATDQIVKHYLALNTSTGVSPGRSVR